jgi:Tautomerase enzyme
MAQVKVYALRGPLERNRSLLSMWIHESLVSELKIPADKKFQRFIELDPENFIFPTDRTENYCIIEIVLFSGRSTDAKKSFIRRLYQKATEHGFSAVDIEIVFLESGRENWGIRGLPADELTLNYQVNVP